VEPEWHRRAAEPAALSRRIVRALEVAGEGLRLGGLWVLWLGVIWLGRLGVVRLGRLGFWLVALGLLRCSVVVRFGLGLLWLGLGLVWLA
jgi:hypothetical protein